MDPLINHASGQFLSFFFLNFRPGVRPDVRAAPVSSEEKQKNVGGPGGGNPPAKPVKGGVWGGFAPPAKKLGGLGGSAPQPKFLSGLPSLQIAFINDKRNTAIILQFAGS